jgi:hypothetical protein
MASATNFIDLTVLFVRRAGGQGGVVVHGFWGILV